MHKHTYATALVLLMLCTCVCVAAPSSFPDSPKPENLRSAEEERRGVPSGQELGIRLGMEANHTRQGGGSFFGVLTFTSPNQHTLTLTLTNPELSNSIVTLR